MDVRLEYDKAKAVKWLMAPGLVAISAEDIADAHNERKAREISRFYTFTSLNRRISHSICRKAEERAASRALQDTGPSTVKVASMVTILKRTTFLF
jgi:hypothetical protein